jgi:hypothetical protein
MGGGMQYQPYNQGGGASGGSNWGSTPQMNDRQMGMSNAPRRTQL